MITQKFLVCVQDWAEHLPGALPIVEASFVQTGPIQMVQIDSYGYGAGKWCIQTGPIAHIIERWTEPMIRFLMRNYPG